MLRFKHCSLVGFTHLQPGWKANVCFPDYVSPFGVSASYCGCIYLMCSLERYKQVSDTWTATVHNATSVTSATLTKLTNRTAGKDL